MDRSQYRNLSGQTSKCLLGRSMWSRFGMIERGGNLATISNQRGISPQTRLHLLSKLQICETAIVVILTMPNFFGVETLMRQGEGMSGLENRFFVSWCFAIEWRMLPGRDRADPSVDHTRVYPALRTQPRCCEQGCLIRFRCIHSNVPSDINPFLFRNALKACKHSRLKNCMGDRVDG
jgi:hypothetical protein